MAKAPTVPKAPVVNDDTAELTEKLTAELTEKLTAELTEKLTAELTEKLTAELTEKLTAELTEKLTAELAATSTKKADGKLQPKLNDREVVTVTNAKGEELKVSGSYFNANSHKLALI